MDRCDQICPSSHLWLCTLGYAQGLVRGGCLKCGPFSQDLNPGPPLVLLAACGAATWGQSGVWMVPKLPRSDYLYSLHPC